MLLQRHFVLVPGFAIAATVFVLFSASGFAEPPKLADGNTVHGTWYLALDAEPFGLPPGTNLPGLLQLHEDGTMITLDLGDLGADPFPTRDTAALGSWSRDRGQVQTRSLFLQIDGESGNALGWNKVELQLSFPDGSVMEGHANVSFLPCDQGTPFPTFFCPSPVMFLDEFEAVPPQNIPIVLTRLPSP